MRFLVRMVILVLVVFGVVKAGLLKADDSFLAAVQAGVLLAFVNAFIKPVLRLIALPLTIATLGLFALVLNVVLFYVVVSIVPDLHIVGFLETVVAAFAVSVTTAILGKVAGL